MTGIAARKMKAAGISWFHTAVTLCFLIIPWCFLYANAQECIPTPCKVNENTPKCGEGCVCSKDPTKADQSMDGVCGWNYSYDDYEYAETDEQGNTGGTTGEHQGSHSPQSHKSNVSGSTGENLGNYWPQSQQTIADDSPAANLGSVSPQFQQTKGVGAPAEYPDDYSPQHQQLPPAGMPGKFGGGNPLLSQNEYPGSTYGRYASNYGPYAKAQIGMLAVQGVSNVISSGLYAYQQRRMMQNSMQYDNDARLPPPPVSVSTPIESPNDSPPPTPTRSSSLSPVPPRNAPPPLPKQTAPTTPSKETSVTRPLRPPPPPPKNAGQSTAPNRRPPTPPLKPPRGPSSSIRKPPPPPPPRGSSLLSPSRFGPPSKPFKMRPLPPRPSSALSRLKIKFPWGWKG